MQVKKYQKKEVHHEGEQEVTSGFFCSLTKYFILSANSLLAGGLVLVSTSTYIYERTLNIRIKSYIYERTLNIRIRSYIYERTLNIRIRSYIYERTLNIRIRSYTFMSEP